MAAEVGHEFIDEHHHQLKRQMGCMAGFFHLFERHHILTPRLPSSQSARSWSPSEKSETSTASTENTSAVTSFASPTPMPAPVFNFKEGVKSHWKLRETPRLSLDSRAIVDAKGKLRPRDIKTTMLTCAQDTTDSDTQRRSPSVVARLMGVETLPDTSPQLRRSASESRVARDPSLYQFIDTTTRTTDVKHNLSEFRVREAKKDFMAEEFFPEPKNLMPLYNEIEKKLRMRGIEDLETVKQILDALHLKGLLHSKSFDPVNRGQMRPAVYKPPRPPLFEAQLSSGERMNAERKLTIRSPERRRPWNSEELPKGSKPNRRTSIPSSRVSPVDKCFRNRRLVREVFTRTDNESSTTLSERSTENRTGRRLLERCDKLLHTIAAFNAAELQPSPVSVLESSSFLRSDNSPSPLSKRSLNFNKEESAECEDEQWSNCITKEDEDYTYVSEILRLFSGYGKAPSNIYAMLEKHRYSDNSKTARLRRRLVFNAVIEILERNQNLSSWESFARANYRPSASGSQITEVWSELQRIREEVVAEDLNGIPCGLIKDMDKNNQNGWIFPATEMSEAVLNIERLIFKDLIGDTIRDLSVMTARVSIRPSFPRRKLNF